MAPAEDALRAVARRPYRDNPEAAIGRLSAVDMEGLPDDLARRVFGVWSNHCLRLVRETGMLEPKRYSPATSRGLVVARRTPDGRFTVVSSLGVPGWAAGQEVTDPHILDAAWPLQDPPSHRAQPRATEPSIET